MKGRWTGSRQIVPIVVIVLGTLLLVFGLASLLSNPFRAAEATPTLAAARIPFPEIPRVSLADARAAYESGGAIFVDVRGEPFYSEGHIKGARSSEDAGFSDWLKTVEPQTWIIPYCT